MSDSTSKRSDHQRKKTSEKSDGAATPLDAKIFFGYAAITGVAFFACFIPLAGEALDPGASWVVCIVTTLVVTGIYWGFGLRRALARRAAGVERQAVNNHFVYSAVLCPFLVLLVFGLYGLLHAGNRWLDSLEAKLVSAEVVTCRLVKTKSGSHTQCELAVGEERTPLSSRHQIGQPGSTVVVRVRDGAFGWRWILHDQ